MSINYKDAGVEVAAGQEEVKLIKTIVEKTHDSNVLSAIGGFSGLYDINFKNIEEPVLASGTDGVGTKVIIAQKMKKNDTIGIDCVAMCVNDILCQGAKPLFFLDYIGAGKLVPEKMAEIVKGVSLGCKIAGASLIGGETAEMPGVYNIDDYDLAGFAVGIVDKKKIIDKSLIKEGDILFGLSSSGIHSNGYSLVRKIVFEENNFSLDQKFQGLEKNLGQTLLEPTKIYVKEMLPLVEEGLIHGMCHITGGGFYENVPRMIPNGFCAKVDLSKVKRPQIFNLLQEWGNLKLEDMYGTFNMGIGLIFAVDKNDEKKVMDHFKDYDSIYKVGSVVKGDNKIDLKY